MAIGITLSFVASFVILLRRANKNFPIIRKFLSRWPQALYVFDHWNAELHLWFGLRLVTGIFIIMFFTS